MSDSQMEYVRYEPRTWSNLKRHSNIWLLILTINGIKPGKLGPKDLQDHSRYHVIWQQTMARLGPGRRGSLAPH